MARSAQTHKSISFIWIIWSTLYVYLCPQGEIWQLSANRSDHELICARYTNLESDGSLKQGANVYRLNDNDDMTLNSEYNIDCKDLSHISWMPGDASKVLVFFSWLTYHCIAMCAPISCFKTECSLEFVRLQKDYISKKHKEILWQLFNFFFRFFA